MCMILIGIGNNLWHPAALSTLGQRFPNRKGLAMSLHGMGGNFGEALAPLLIGALLVTYSWRSVVVINLLPGLVMAIALLVLLGKMNLDHGKDVKSAKDTWTLKGYCGQLKTLFSDWALVLISLCAMFRTAAQSALLTFLPLYLTNNMGYTPAGVGVALFTLQACAFASAPLAGYVSDRLGRKSVLTGGLHDRSGHRGVSHRRGFGLGHFPHRPARLLHVCDAPGDPGMVARDRAGPDGGNSGRHSVWRTGARCRDLTVGGRRYRRCLRAQGRVLFPHESDRDRERAGSLHP